jgi:hypothetical protein
LQQQAGSVKSTLHADSSTSLLHSITYAVAVFAYQSYNTIVSDVYNAVITQAGDLIKGLNLTGMQDQITVDQGKEPAFLQAVFAACSACVIVVRGDSVSGCHSFGGSTADRAAQAVAFVVKESTVYSAAVMAEQTDLATLLHSGVPARACCLVVVPVTTTGTGASKTTAGAAAKVRGLRRNFYIVHATAITAAAV